MRLTLVAIVLLLAAVAAYYYKQNPQAGEKVVHDVTSFVAPAANTNTPVGQQSAAALAAAESKSSDPSSAASPVPAVASNADETSAAQNSDAPSPVVKAWAPPAIIPSQPHWTWKTTDGKTYHDVQIVKVEADAITILHADGGGRVPMSTLSPDIQKYFNYDPDAAAQSAKQYQTEEATSSAVESQFERKLIRYSLAKSQAKATNKLLLLDFTGSDWCPYCKYLDEEVLATRDFQLFSAANFVFVTLDFPHRSELPADLKNQNAFLYKKYNVNGYPTLLVTDAEGNELGRTAGYQPGSGPEAVIGVLKPFCKR